MGFKNFRLNIILRVILLALVMIALIYTISIHQRYLTIAGLGISFLIILIELIRYTEHVNRKFENFLLAIKNNDFSEDFSSDNRGKTFGKLNEAYSVIIDEFKNLRSKEEIFSNYLQILINNLQVSIISYDKNVMIK